MTVEIKTKTNKGLFGRLLQRGRPRGEEGRESTLTKDQILQYIQQLSETVKVISNGQEVLLDTSNETNAFMSFIKNGTVNPYAHREKYPSSRPEEILPLADVNKYYEIRAQLIKHFSDRVQVRSFSKSITPEQVLGIVDNIDKYIQRSILNLTTESINSGIVSYNWDGSEQQSFKKGIIAELTSKRNYLIWRNRSDDGSDRNLVQIEDYKAKLVDRSLQVLGIVPFGSVEEIKDIITPSI